VALYSGGPARAGQRRGRLIVVWLGTPPRTPLPIIAEDGRIFPGRGEGSDTRVNITMGPLEYFKGYGDYC
jgi:hypothetical protein